MADLTMLHAPSTLYLPEPVETGLRFTFNRRSLPPHPLLCTTPMVTVEMVETGSPPSSPIMPEDTNFLSPPRRNFKSRRPLRDLPPRPSSAPPERPSGRITGRCISSPDLLLPPPHTADPLSGRSYATPVVVRPPTTLFRPKPFWRNTRRSGVTESSYASSLHPIRRSTFIAAGLPFDKPVADLSALGVESRIGIVVLLPDSLP